MKLLTLAVWAIQFGFSAVLPVCLWFVAGSWLQMRFDLGSQVMFWCFLLGALTTVGTVRNSLRWILDEMGLRKGRAYEISCCIEKRN